MPNGGGPDGYSDEIKAGMRKKIRELEAEVERLKGTVFRAVDKEAENMRLREALGQVAAYGGPDICPYGCDTPFIARKALEGEG